MSDNLATDVAVLKTQVGQTKTVIDRIESTLARLTEINNNAVKLLAVHENKLENHELSIAAIQKETETKVSSLHDRIEELKNQNHKEREKFHRELMDAITMIDEKYSSDRRELSDRITALEKWRWAVMGMVAILTYIVSNLQDLVSLFS